MNGKKLNRKLLVWQRPHTTNDHMKILIKESSFASSTREGRKALAKRIYSSERGWQG